MIITICASLRFKEEIEQVAEALRSMGHQVCVPEAAPGFDYWDRTHREAAEIKKRYSFMRIHFERIEKSDAILVLNYDVGKVKNYIGRNSFGEMGVAYYPRRPIYLLNPIPEMLYTSEIEAMEPIILNGDLAKIDGGEEPNPPLG